MRTLLLRLLELFTRRARERRLDAEIQAHLDLLTGEHMARGLSREDALLAARRSFGGVDQIKELYRDQRGLPALEMLLQDIRFALRLMRKHPGFTLTTGGSLALSIGALTLAFSAVNALVLKPLPIRDPESVYFVQSGSGGWSYPDYTEMRDRTANIDMLAGYRITMMSVGVAREPEILWGYLVSGNYFDGLGIAPALGRFFTAEEDRERNGSPWAVISYDTWQSRFAGRRDIVGHTLDINGLPYTVLGVAPRGFHGTEVFYRPEIWVPMTMQEQIEVGSAWLTRRENQNVMLVTRLAPGVSKSQGEAALAATVEQLNREYPNRNGRLRAHLTRPGLFGDMLGPPVRAFVWGLFALGGVLLLAGCSNLAGVLLARGTDRAREIAMRAALGAGKRRIVRQLVTESLLLAGVGGLAGGLIALAGTRIASAWRLPTELPVQIELTADVTVFGFAFAAALIVGAVVGIAPARFASRLDLNHSLRSSATLALGRRRFQMREVLVCVQVALCIVLLHASFLAVRGLQRASTASIGWNPSGIVMAATELGLARYDDGQVAAYYRRAVEEARALPGVSSAAVASSVPLYIDQGNTTIYALPVTEPEVVTGASPYTVSPGFFATMQIRILDGRDFTDFDTARAPQVAIVNRALARHLFGTAPAIGRQFREGRGGAPTEIIGIVEDGKYRAIAESTRAALFRPVAQRYSRSSMIVARVSAAGMVGPDDLRHVIQRIDPNLPIRIATTGEQITAFPLLPYRVAAAALGLLGLICSGLLLSGLHAMLAYAVARRQREIGIRIALGADRSSVVLAVLSRVVMVLGVGIGLGALVSAGTGPLISSMVLGVSPREPFVLLAIVLGLGVITLTSCAGPVRRSLRLDPLVALRDE